jgi:hypothetical protein
MVATVFIGCQQPPGWDRDVEATRRSLKQGAENVKEAIENPDSVRQGVKKMLDNPVPLGK